MAENRSTDTAESGDIIRCPYDGHEVGRMPKAGEKETEQAIQGAVEAFETMRRLPRFVRAEILEQSARLLGERRDELARLIAAEAGKPLYDARGEVSRALFNLRNAAAEARSWSGHEVPLDVDGSVFEYQTASPDGDVLDLGQTNMETLARLGRRLGIARRFPVGPVLAITPFNFPLNLVVHKLAPAIAVGCSVVLKPAPQTPLTSAALADILNQAGLPACALSVVHCDPELAERMVRDPRLAMVSFTGSAAVGWRVKENAGRKKVTLELGGNAAVVIDRDADLDLAAARCVRGGVVYGGQYCIGVQRILVHRDCHDEFLERLMERVRACSLGNPLEDGVDIGPVIDEKSAIRIESWIGEAVADGATVLTGGKRYGALIEPTVLADVRPSMKIEDEEIFGPVMTLSPIDDIEEGIRRANDSRYGLQGGLFTNNLRMGLQALEDWDVGALMINDVPIYRIDNMPFGGWKESGFGREGTRYAMEEMTDIKFLVVNYG